MAGAIRKKFLINMMRVSPVIMRVLGIMRNANVFVQTRIRHKCPTDAYVILDMNPTVTAAV